MECPTCTEMMDCMYRLNVCGIGVYSFCEYCGHETHFADEECTSPEERARAPHHVPGNPGLTPRGRIFSAAKSFAAVVGGKPEQSHPGKAEAWEALREAVYGLESSQSKQENDDG